MVDIFLLEFANDNKRGDNNKNKKEEKPEQEQNKDKKKPVKSKHKETERNKSSHLSHPFGNLQQNSERSKE